MSDVSVDVNYLDLDRLQEYDKLIKEYIPEIIPKTLKIDALQGNANKFLNEQGNWIIRNAPRVEGDTLIL